MLLVLAFSAVNAQDASRIPADLQRLEAATADTARAALLNSICFNYADKDPAKGLAFGEQGLALAIRLRSEQALAHARSSMGYCYIRLSEFHKADSISALALHGFERTGDRCRAALTIMNLGLSREMRHDEARALELFQQAEKEGEACSDASARSALLYSMGGPYERMGRLPEALDRYMAAYVLDSTRHDSSRLAKDHIAIANVHGASHRLDDAMRHYRSSIRCSQAIGDTLVIGYVRYNCAEIEKMRGDPVRAVEYGEQAVAVFEQLHRRAELVHAEVFLGELYLHAGRPSDARRVLDHAIALAVTMGLGEERMHALRLSADASKSQGDPVRAFGEMEAYIALKDSLDTDAQNARVAELTAKYESEKKDKELAEARAKGAALHDDARQQRAQKTIFLISALLLAALAVLLISRMRLKRRLVAELGSRNQEILRQKERAEASERAKARFLANVSHEIRTPLNAIIGFTDLLLYERHDAQTRHYLGSVRDAGENLLVLINDVLDLSRMEAGRLTLMHEPFDLHRSVRHCAELLQHRANEQHDRLTMEVAPEVPQWVLGDGARLTQMLLNLVGNALKFTTGGSVSLLVDMMGSAVRFRVIDTGIGIAPDKLKIVFERFTQVHASDQHRYGGTGLGLSIVKELVALHKGRIDVESEPGKGTTFTLELPYQAVSSPAPEVSTATNALSNYALQDRIILVAEDNPLNVQVTTATLKRHYPHAQVMVVGNGREAVDRVLSDIDQDIALVLMDVQMPVLDGLAATRELRVADLGPTHLPIIALTASVLPGDLSQCIDAGMDACVPKPFRTHELVGAIARLTGDSGVQVTSANEDSDGADDDALFLELVPERLQRLRSARAEGDHAEMKRLVHFMRFQLVRYDEARFADQLERLLRSEAGSAFDTDVDALITKLEEELA